MDCTSLWHWLREGPELLEGTAESQRLLLVAPGITRNKKQLVTKGMATSNKKLLVAPGIATSNKGHYY